MLGGVVGEGWEEGGVFWGNIQIEDADTDDGETQEEVVTAIHHRLVEGSARPTIEERVVE